MSLIKIQISNDPISGLPRELQMGTFRIEEDKEMTLRATVVLLDQSGNNLLDTIRDNPNFTESQRAQFYLRYKDFEVIKTTRNSFINPITKEIHLLDDTGNVPDGFISELTYFQNIKVGDIVSSGLPVDGNTSVADIVYFMLMGQLISMAERSQV